jgi:hypothetical protein
MVDMPKRIMMLGKRKLIINTRMSNHIFNNFLHGAHMINNLSTTQGQQKLVFLGVGFMGLSR